MIKRFQRHKTNNLIDIFSVKNKKIFLLSNEATDFIPPPSKGLLCGSEVPFNNANNFNEDNIIINRINLLNQYPEINNEFISTLNLQSTSNLN